MPSSVPDIEFDGAAARAGVLARIRAAALSAGRDPADVTLVAVSKQQPWAKVRALLDAGHTAFGENRVQEAEARWAEVCAAADVELRMIGPLQTNKVAQAVRLFRVIETVDRERLARALAEAAARSGQYPRLYVQVNTGAEPQKSGVLTAEADSFIATVRKVYGLAIEGLMCIPPMGEAPGPHFALLARIAARNGLGALSMGMSDDYETAVRFGATSVRVGSALFGSRALIADQ